MGILSCGRSLLIYRYVVCGFFIKTLIIMSISTNIYRISVCDALGPYILLVNNIYLLSISTYRLINQGSI